MAQGTTRGVPIDIDPTLSNNSDLLVASQKATKTYVDNGLLNKQNILSQATASTNGYLSSTDWSTFNGKLSNNAWIDYSATSTITGWASFTLKQLKYKIVGNMMFVNYALYGTSNANTTSFTLPNNAIVQTENPNRSQNNGVWYHGFGIILPASNLVTFNYWQLVTSYTPTWTASGSKVVSGQICFEI